MNVELIGLAIFGLLLAGVVWWLLQQQRRHQQQENRQMQAQLSESLKQMTDHVERVSERVDRRLQENVKAVNESKTFLVERVSTTERTVREVTASLSKLEQATASLKSSTDEIANFQQLLRSPKVRGSFGEVLLGNLLSDVFPSDRYRTQYTLPGSGEIADAVIFLQDSFIVAVDAKFPLASYEALANSTDKDERRRIRSQLVRDIKKHVSDISRKYISPADKTLDYAFMYIPMEAVYYETMVQDESGDTLWDFCLQHKIVPVSPNSFLAYLQTVLVGLRGMKIEKQARNILDALRQVRKDFSRFAEDFSMVGRHLGNAKNRYDDSSRRLDKFVNRLEQLDSTFEHVEGGSAPLPEGVDREE